MVVVPARLLGSDRMQHDEAVEVEEDRHLRLHRIGSEIVEVQAKDSGFPIAAGMEKVTDRGHMHDTETKALGMWHASVVEMRRVTLPGSEVVLGMTAQEMLHVDMEKARGLGRMRDTVRVVQASWLWADTVLEAPEKVLCDTDVAVVEQAILLCDTDVAAVEQATLLFADTGIELAVLENAPERMIHV